MRLFALDLTASDTARLTGLSVRPVNALYLRLRHQLQAECPVPVNLVRAVELDESYLRPAAGAGQARARDRGQNGGLRPVQTQRPGLHGNRPSCQKKTLQDIIRGKIDILALVNPDGWRGYDGLVNNGCNRYFRVHHERDEFVQCTSPINRIESFWSLAKAQLQKFRGVAKNTFKLPLKEGGFRFNHRHQDLYETLPKLLPPAVSQFAS